MEPGPAPFDTYKYNMSCHRALRPDRRVPGRRRQPAAHHRAVDLSVAPANPASAKALGDTSGALLEAKFQIRTYVKSASAAEGEASGT